MSTMERPPILVVLGMHRSGTSAVAGALVRRGANAGQALLPSTSDNANGYFEDARLVAASDALLSAAGLAWDEPGPVARPIDAPAAHAAMVEVFAALRASSTVPVVKDPRACRLVPEWSRSIDCAGLRPAYLIVLRDPREVAASLRVRDGMSSYRAHSLWLEHLLDAEHATRGTSRAFIDFDALLRDPEGVLDSVLSSLEPAFGASLDASRSTGIEPALRRQRVDARARGTFVDEVYAFARRLHGAAGDDATSAARFDAFRERWKESVQAGKAAVADAQERERRAQERDGRMAREVRSGLAIADAWRPAQMRDPTPRLYWRTSDAEYSEDRSVAAVRANDGRAQVMVGTLGQRVEFIRIDPDDHAGVFEILDLRLDGTPVPDVLPLVRASNGVVRATPGGLMLMALDDDPWIEIDATSAVPARTSISFLLRMRGLPDLLWRLVDEQAVGATRLRQVEERLEAMAVRQQALANDVTAMRRTLDIDVEAQRQWQGDLSRQLAEGLEWQDDISRQLAGGLELQGHVSKQLVEVLRWTRRRTVGYWWRRLRGVAPSSEDAT